MDNIAIVAQINEALDKIRPYLNADGGDVTFKGITPEMYVQVHLEGACGDCPYSEHTLKAGVEETLMQEVQGIKGIIAI